MSAPIGLAESFLGAIQASLSVLLVIFYGGVAARLKLLSPENTKAVSKVCVRFFLPALLITKLGSELEPGSAHRYVIVLVWAIACHLVSFLVGIFAHLVLGMPDWVTVALMFNNTTSYPLLLVSALGDTGILRSLVPADESTADAIERAKSYFLVFSTVSSCLTFAVGPRLIDSEHAPERHHEDDEDKTAAAEDDNAHAVLDPEAADERTTLLGSRPDSDADANVASPPVVSPNGPLFRTNSFFPSRRRQTLPLEEEEDTRRSHSKEEEIEDRRAFWIPRKHWTKLGARTRWWLLFASDFFNAPLIGALAGAVIGMVPALRRAFFSHARDGGIFTAWLTASLQSIGGLFVPLPVIVAGVSLYTSWTKASSGRGGSEAKLPRATAAFILLARFVAWPVVSIAVVYGLARGTKLLGDDDPMLRFALMLMPTGPSAMKLITLVQVSEAGDDEEMNIAKLLTISYMISPILSFTVVGSLVASQASM